MEHKYVRHTYSYLNLRCAVGWIGLLLPFVLAGGAVMIGTSSGIERSISFYYYTGMGDVFVGALCAVALFMFFYTGYGQIDNWAGNIAGFSLVGVAWFPTTVEGAMGLVGIVHFTCATAFFLTTAFFSLVLFTRTDKPHAMGERKKVRNTVYRACGVSMLASLAAILIFYIAGGNKSSSFIFFAETVAMVAFGISWLTKGETLYPDKA